MLIYDDFRADNEATVRRVQRFLDVDDTAGSQVTEANPTVRVRSTRLYELERSLSARARPGRARREGGDQGVDAATSAPRRVLATAPRSVGQPRPADERLMLELRGRFKGEVVALGEYLDRDLVSLWGYDRIG